MKHRREIIRRLMERRRELEERRRRYRRTHPPLRIRNPMRRSSEPIAFDKVELPAVTVARARSWLSQAKDWIHGATRRRRQERA